MVKKIFAIVIACIPFRRMRIFLYNAVLSYSIAYDAKIGMFNLLLCDVCKIASQAYIGMFNRICCKEFMMDEQAVMRRYNVIANIEKFKIYNGGGNWRQEYF